MTVTVTVSTTAGIDLSTPTLYDEFANSPIGAGGTSTDYLSVDTGAFNGHHPLIQFAVHGSCFTYSGSFPNIQLTGSTITSVTVQDQTSNNLATITGSSI